MASNYYRKKITYRDVNCQHKFVRIRTKWEKWAQPVMLFVCRNCTTLVQKHLYLVETAAGPTVKIKKVFVKHGDFKPIPEEEVRSEAIINIALNRKPGPIFDEPLVSSAPAGADAPGASDAPSDLPPAEARPV